jgi:hypothetical protein
MANDLQTISNPSLATLCSKGFESYVLESIVDRPMPGITERVINPAERACLARLAAEYERALVPAPRSAIEESVAMLSLAYPALKATPQEAAARIELYAQALADIPPDVLHDACMKALRESRFFPSVSEIRERCAGLALAHYRLGRINYLIAKHDAEWRDPEPEAPMTTAERNEMDRLKRKFGLGQPSADTEQAA